MTSPTQKTLKLLRAEGWECAIVERWNSYAHVRQDLYGFIDVLACHPGSRRIVGFQIGALCDISKKITKILMEPRAKTWLQAGAEIIVIGWGKRKTMDPYEMVPITLGNFAELSCSYRDNGRCVHEKSVGRQCFKIEARECPAGYKDAA